jgi:CheY-like chemotaxis protein
MEKRNILIVDDDEYYLRLVASIFGHNGIHICYAMSGEEAVGILKENCFSTMITDLNMPGMDGFELAMIAKELSPDIEIVLITGDISPHLSRLAAQAGISRVVTKPCEVEQIQKIVWG